MCLKTALTAVKRQMYNDVKMDTWMADKCGNWTVQNPKKQYLQNNANAKQCQNTTTKSKTLSKEKENVADNCLHKITQKMRNMK